MKIDEEFKSLIPPLSQDEYKGLEESILSEGVRESLIVWDAPDGDRYLIDGHNRYEIAQKHHLPFNVRRMEFEDRNAVIRWMILNQFGRRNLSAYDRSILALKLKPMIQEKAKEKQSEAGGAVRQKSDKAEIDTKKELAKVAGVSHDTIHKVETIEKKAPERIKELAQSGEISINQAYHETMNIIKPNPKPIRKQAEERHSEIRNSDVVSMAELKADKHDQAIIALGICKDLMRLGNELSSIASDDDLKCCEELDEEEVRDAIRNCTKIVHQAEIIRRELLEIGKK